MKTTRRHVGVFLAGVLMLGSIGCADDLVSPLDDAAILLSVVPNGGSVDVPAGTSVVVTFNHAMGLGMEAYGALHEGSLTGPEVEGSWTMSPNRMVIIFEPTKALKAATTYVIHLGGGMTDDHGNLVGLSQHGPGMGGVWTTGSMMTGGMGVGQGNARMMGEGWAHPTNGSYGMIFSFTTAGTT
jgi:hypothetical protein